MTRYQATATFIETRRHALLAVLDHLVGEPRRNMVVKLMAYGAVSGVALCVDFTVYLTALRYVGLAAVASGFGYVAGVATHYTLSSRVVFKDKISARGMAAEMPVIAKFIAAGVTGLFITTAVVGVLADGLGFNPILAKIMAAGCSFFAVFVSLNFLVFADTRRNATSA